MAPLTTPLAPRRWMLRDYVAAGLLFLATAAVVLWQNAHVAVLWDLSYLLDSSFRMSLGQVPYRDFPFAHAPLTFLVQAVIIRLTGRVFFHHVLYAAIVSGLGTVVTWRIALHMLEARLAEAWVTSLLLSTPLIVLGIYCVYPIPIYDCDCIASILVTILMLQRLQRPSTRPRVRAVAAGVALVVPVFYKQNIGLPFLLTVICGIMLIVAMRFFFHRKQAVTLTEIQALVTALFAAMMTLLLALLLLHVTVGIGNYVHWTVKFAAERRLPGLGDMLEIYADSTLRWTLPCIAAGLLLLRGLRPTQLGPIQLWARLVALGLLAAPFLATFGFLFLNNDSGDRAGNLLALWPLVLILAAILSIYQLRRSVSLATVLLIAMLAAIHGTLLSQQLWGSTYALWPLFILLLASMISSLSKDGAAELRTFVLPLASIIAATLLVCGGFYAASEDRLSYAQVSEGAMHHSSLAPLAGLAVRGTWLPDFEELVQFTAAEIPKSAGIILMNGEDPFYFTTGRAPQFPVLLFDKATDPYSPAQVVEVARTRNIRWLILKRSLQMNEDPTPQREATLDLLSRDFIFYRGLKNYDIFRRR